MTHLSRRRLLRLLAAGAAGATLNPTAADVTPEMQKKPIPSSDEHIPVIGMGTWKTFNVGRDRQLRLDRTRVLAAFFRHGGGMVDCSPMYGSAGAVMGFALAQLNNTDPLFAAEKVWTNNGSETRQQIAGLESTWDIAPFDLMQVHNLVAWQKHLETLQAMKQQGSVRYIGITTSHGRRHKECERIMTREDIDFVQLTYSITHREAERRLLPLARERGIAVIANRPYDHGPLIRRLKSREKIPEWAEQAFDCRTWADFLLRFIVSHPALTCAIPATTRVDHMNENMQAGAGPMPTPELRQRMVRYIEAL